MAETAPIERVATRFDDAPVAVVRIASLNDAHAVRDSFPPSIQRPYSVLLDVGGTAWDDYHVVALPETFVIDPDGQLVAKFPLGFDETEVSQVIQEILDDL